MELTVAIIASCIPTLRPLWTVVVDRYRLYYSGKKSGYTIHIDDRHDPEAGNKPLKRFPHACGVNNPSHSVIESVASANQGRYLDTTVRDNSSRDLSTIRKTTEVHMESYKET